MITYIFSSFDKDIRFNEVANYFKNDMVLYKNIVFIPANFENMEKVNGYANIDVSWFKEIGINLNGITVLNDTMTKEEMFRSIENADIIIMGPGSLYTSIIPNLLVNGVVDAIEKSKAPKVYICNIMTQPGETDDHNVLDHVNAIVKHTNKNIIDYVISNNEVLPKEMIVELQNLQDKVEEADLDIHEILEDNFGENYKDYFQNITTKRLYYI